MTAVEAIDWKTGIGKAYADTVDRLQTELWQRRKQVDMLYGALTDLGWTRDCGDPKEWARKRGKELGVVPTNIMGPFTKRKT